MTSPTRREMLCGACSLALLVGCEGPEPAPDPATEPLPTASPAPLTPTVEPFAPCEVEAGTAAEGWVRFGYDTHPQLEEERGAAYVSLGGVEIVIAQVEPGCFVAVERACTHEGVLIDYRPDRNGLVCPRHGAIYALDGRVLAGPAPQDLVVYQAAERDGAVWVRST